MSPFLQLQINVFFYPKANTKMFDSDEYLIKFCLIIYPFWFLTTLPLIWFNSKLWRPWRSNRRYVYAHIWFTRCKFKRSNTGIMWVEIEIILNNMNQTTWITWKFPFLLSFHFLLSYIRKFCVNTLIHIHVHVWRNK